MERTALIAIDLVAILILTFGLYFPRHRRKDMLVAYLVANLGVVAVADALASSTAIGAGLGLGLFGILSIIRLRSNELDQQEIAYYFASLAMGLLAGLATEPNWLTPTLMAGLIVSLFVADHPDLFGRYRVQTVTLDAAYTSEPAMIARLESMLDARVRRIRVRKVDLVRDTTTVEVRYELRGDAGGDGPARRAETILGYRP